MKLKYIGIAAVTLASVIIVTIIINPTPPIRPEPINPIQDPIVPELPTATATEIQQPDTPNPGDLITPTQTSTPSSTPTLSTSTPTPSSTPTVSASMPNYTVTCGVHTSHVSRRSNDDTTLVRYATLFINVTINRPVNNEIFQFVFKDNQVPDSQYSYAPRPIELVHIMGDGETEGWISAGGTDCIATCSGYFNLVSVSVANRSPPASNIPKLEGLNEKCHFTVPGP